MAVDGRLEYGDGTRRHDYQVVGNVEFLSAPRATQPEEPAPAEPAKSPRKNQEPAAA